MSKKHEIWPFGVAIVVIGAGPAQAGAAGENAGGARPSVNTEAVRVCNPARNTDFAFTSSADGDSKIYLYDGKAASIRKLTDNDAQDHWATWYPDGKYLAFQSLRDGNREIYLLNLASSVAQNISNHPEQDLLPSWSPARSVLLTTFAQDNAGRVFDSRCVAGDGTYDVPIIDDASDARAAAWRPKSE
ncbi:MAG: hypothetical protein OER22_09520 [Gammaproteobacteria bacterium]|nr:hypothetical protein [Gammaproteobacteria bacterium]MDH3374369.1 hypothetical protein [Gammaproteobacteria bacterium]MDH3552839.1 hypothetical protein [Gammaproteobacteria bacterium]